MKSKRIRLIAAAMLTAALMVTGVSAYADCLECSFQANQGRCMNNYCGYLVEYGSMCCGTSI